MQASLRLDSEVFQTATLRAASANVSVSKLVNETLKKVFAEDSKAEARRERLSQLYGSITDPTFVMPEREFDRGNRVLEEFV
ncbi:MAG: hypothetical protein LBP75_02110 [Planctomycetota bacterium]|nr:hypothetical protein [Planctomycetota bacterium]